TNLNPGETWIYRAVGVAADLASNPSGITTVPGCDPEGTGNERPTYSNLGTVIAGTVTDSDPSHYCNPPSTPAIALKKYTNGQDANGPNDGDVPEIALGDPVTWTYRVSNIGNVAFAAAAIQVSDNIVGPVTTIIDQGDGDNSLAPGEEWL